MGVIGKGLHYQSPCYIQSTYIQHTNGMGFKHFFTLSLKEKRLPSSVGKMIKARTDVLVEKRR